ncbi:MAG: EamA family transporter [Candidatus Nanopelagicales bacterium]
MWVAWASGSALFAGLVAILAKVGIKHTSSNLATAIRTIVVLVFAWLMVFVVGSEATLAAVSSKTLLFLVLSGLATGASWLCYFRALQIGPVSPVVAIDKSSIVLTVLLGIVLFGETTNLLVRLLGISVIAVGTLLMLPQRRNAGPQVQGRQWLMFALLSSVFASLTTALAKVGIENIESNLGTAIRTAVVLVMAWVVVLVTGEHRLIRAIPARDLVFIGLSGLATGASWLCFYKALQVGPVSGVVPIDKLSILVTIGFSYFLFRERLSARSGLGLALIVAGTLAMVV